ncbi:MULTISPECIES: hypothetical protein [Sulfolobaceae]|uniref:hypothetical protein n=1 Tax=Sulfolobaceae TaxID=118883 RepID=UPI003165128D
MESTINLKGSLAYIYKVLVDSLIKMKVQPIAGAIDENNLVIGVKLADIAEIITSEIDKGKWKMKLNEGKLYLKSNEKANEEELREVNKNVLSKIRKLGIDSGAYITDDNETVILIDVEGIVRQVLQNALMVTRDKVGSHMRLVRTRFGTLEGYTYILLYKKGKETNGSELRKMLDEVS